MIFQKPHLQFLLLGVLLVVGLCLRLYGIRSTRSRMSASTVASNFLAKK